MRKCILILMTTMILCLTACSRNTLDFSKLDKSSESITSSEVIATIKGNIFDKSTENIILSLENKTNNTYTYDVRFNLEIEKDGLWYKIPFKEDMSFIEIAYILQPNTTVEHQINLSYFSQLTQGRYRITKTLTSQNKNITVAAEFKIEDK